MINSASFKFALISAIALGALCASARLGNAEGYVQTDLVSNIPGLAPVTDSNLINPWGVSFIPGLSPFWVSNQGASTSTLYGATNPTSVNPFPFPPATPLVVSIPTTSSGPQGPTGQVSNPNMASFIVDGEHAFFIFANLNGTISAWNPNLGTTAQIEATGATGSLYTGLAINQKDTMLYAANDSLGRIDVFNSTFTPTMTGLVPNAFKTPGAVIGLGRKLGVTFVPFNVQDIGGNVYVTYAPAGHSAQTTAPLGEGAVAVFSESGKLEASKTLIGGDLAAPWGVALAPSDFGQFSNDLLVGNFSYDNSEILAFNPVTRAFEGTIRVDPGAGDTAGGLWTLTFGGGGLDGSPDVLYFTDGINGEMDGLFGAISTIPEASTWAMMLAGFAGLSYVAFCRARRSGVALADE